MMFRRCKPVEPIQQVLQTMFYRVLQTLCSTDLKESVSNSIDLKIPKGSIETRTCWALPLQVLWTKVSRFFTLLVLCRTWKPIGAGRKDSWFQRFYIIKFNRLFRLCSTGFYRPCFTPTDLKLKGSIDSRTWHLQVLWTISSGSLCLKL